jgi:hypothetical protein
MSQSRWAALALSLCVAAAPARAGTFNGVITGQVTQAGANVPGVAVGDLVTGSYSYNSAVTASNGPITVNPFTAFSLTIGTNPHVFDLADITPQFGGPPGKDLNHSIPGTDALLFYFNFPVLDAFVGASTVSGEAGPGLPPNQSLNIQDLSDPSYSFTFSFVATSQPAVVPEPTGLTLAAVCVAGLLSRAWRRRTAA